MLGTMQINHVGMPMEIKDAKDKETLSSELSWRETGDTVLESYLLVKTSKEKKNVVINVVNNAPNT